MGARGSIFMPSLAAATNMGPEASSANTTYPYADATLIADELTLLSPTYRRRVCVDHMARLF